MGNPTTYDIVSNADTVIVLNNPCTSFALWNECAPYQIPEESPFPTRISKKGKKKANKKKHLQLQKENSQGSVSSNTIAVEETPSASTAESSSVSNLLTVDSFEPGQGSLGTEFLDTERKITIPSHVTPVETESNDSSSNVVMLESHEIGAVLEATIGLQEEEGIRFRVCAGNLMSASPWFNRVLQKNGWSESHRNPADKCFHISARDWDEEAFVILMDVFHLRNNRVPRTLTLELLAKIAMLADYYECSESVDLFVNIWVADLSAKTPIPESYCRDLILWIWISWTFKLTKYFERATAVAVTKSTEPIRNLGLPIPSWITDEIDHRRYCAMESIASGLAKQLDIYRSATYTCPMGSSHSFMCGSMLFGALTKRMDSLNLISTELDWLFLGQNFDDLSVKVRSMESEGWMHRSYTSHSCNISTAITSIVDAAVAGVTGLIFKEESHQAEGIT